MSDEKNIVQLVEEMRSTVEKSGENLKSFNEKVSRLDGVDKERIEKLDSALEKLDKKNQELLLSIKKEENEKKEFEERLLGLEKEIITKSTDNSFNLKDSQEYKAFNTLVQKGSFDAIEAEQKALLRTDIGSQGGFLVPEAIAQDVLKKVEEISDVRRLARVRTTQTKTLNIPIRSALPTASYEGEAEAASTTASTYANETMTASRQEVVVPVTRDQLAFSGFDMENEIVADAVTAFAKGEGSNFVNGNGVKKPLGILDPSTGIATTTSATSEVITFDEVIELAGELKIGYNPVYAFNRKTLTELRTKKDSNNQYLWQLGGESMPTTISGIPYVILQDMPDIAANSLSVLIGDFFRGYNILDALQMELVRDEYTRKTEAIIEYAWYRYNDGRPVLPEAFKILKTKA